jgi:hypothetical protein
VNRPYLRPGRLGDVLALIQVLSLDEHAHRSEQGLVVELQGPPSSGASWRALAQEHPEFFRVKATGDHAVSLTARHVLPKVADVRPSLPADFTHQLLRTAIELHDRQVEASERWRTLIPLIAVILTGLFSLGAVYLGWHLGRAAPTEQPVAADGPDSGS